MTLKIKDKRSEGSKSIEHKEDEIIFELRESGLTAYIKNKRYKKDEFFVFNAMPRTDGATDYFIQVPDCHIDKEFHNLGVLNVTLKA